MVASFPCEEPEYLLELLRKRKFQGTKLRTNVARGQPTEKHPSGRVMLKDAVLSDVVNLPPHELRAQAPPLGRATDTQQKSLL